MSAHWMLRFLHFLFAVSLTIAEWLRRYKLEQPKPLLAQRSKIPKHLCLNLVAANLAADEAENAFLKCIQDVASWCRALGIEALTVYDLHGVLYGCATDVHRRIFFANDTREDSCESEVEYPLTPPLSESSGSRCHTPQHMTCPAELNVLTMMHSSPFRKRRNVAVRNVTRSASSNLTLHLVSRTSGKPAIVSASRNLLQECVANALVSCDAPTRPRYSLTVSKLARVLEDGLPPPDFMIIHHVDSMKVPYPPMEFYGFPPWQITLTEFHRTQPDDSSGLNDSHALLSETMFCRALDEYAGAEFRLGR